MRFFRIYSATFALGLALAAAIILPLATQPAYSQAISTNGGAIQGTVSDPSGAVIPGAKITVSSPDMGFTRALTSDSAGFYSLGPLTPGRYTITVEAAGFDREVLKTVVVVGTVSSGNVRLKIGAGTTVIEVDASALQQRV